MFLIVILFRLRIAFIFEQICFCFDIVNEVRTVASNLSVYVECFIDVAGIKACIFGRMFVFRAIRSVAIKNPCGKKVVLVDFNVDLTKISLKVGYLL